MSRRHDSQGKYLIPGHVCDRPVMPWGRKSRNITHPSGLWPNGQIDSQAAAHTTACSKDHYALFPTTGAHQDQHHLLWRLNANRCPVPTEVRSDINGEVRLCRI